MTKSRNKPTIGVYSNQDNSPLVQALYTGITTIGSSAVRRNANPFNINDVEDFSIVFVESGIGGAGLAVDIYKDIVPTFELVQTSEGKYKINYKKEQAALENQVPVVVVESLQEDESKTTAAKPKKGASAPVNSKSSVDQQKEAILDEFTLNEIAEGSPIQIALSKI